jgi:hypothetical protein
MYKHQSRHTEILQLPYLVEVKFLRSFNLGKEQCGTLQGAHSIARDMFVAPTG